MVMNFSVRQMRIQVNLENNHSNGLPKNSLRIDTTAFYGFVQMCLYPCASYNYVPLSHAWFSAFSCYSCRNWGALINVKALLKKSFVDILRPPSRN